MSEREFVYQMRPKKPCKTRVLEFSERHKGILKKEVKFIYLFSKCKRKFKKGVFENEKIIMVYIDRTGGRIYGSNSSSTNYGSSFR